MLLQGRLQLATVYLTSVLKANAPFDKGNLVASIMYREIVGSYGLKYEVLIGGELVEYAAATNEEWVAERWGGKTNPNQAWVERALSIATPTMKEMLKGAIDAEDIQVLIREQESILQATRLARANELQAQENARRLRA